MLHIDTPQEQLKKEGNAFFEQHNYAKALKKYNKALEYDQRHEAVLINKALTYKQLNQYDEALEVLESLLLINPNHIKGLYQKAWILQQQGHHHLAKPFYKHILAIEPAHVTANMGLFQCDQQTNAKVILAVADLKLTADNQVKILEFGNYLQSSCSGYEELTGKKILDHVKEIGLPPLYLAMRDYTDNVHLECNDLKSQSTLFSDLEIASHSAMYSGWAIKELNKDILVLGDTAIDTILSHKTLIHDCFIKSTLLHLRPNTFKIDRIQQTNYPLLAKTIREKLPNAKRFIIKTPEECRGEGVIVINQCDLEIILELLLSKESVERVIKVAAHFKLDQKHMMRLEVMRLNNPTYYLVEEYVFNKSILYQNKEYDATMRFVFAFTRNNMTETKIIPLAYYWKLPPQSIDSTAELRERCISSYTETHHLSAEVSESDAETVFNQLKDTLPVLFTVMFQQDMIALAKEDVEKNANSFSWQLLARTATEFGYFEIAKYAFKQSVAQKEKTVCFLTNYHSSLGAYYYLTGDYAKAVEEFSITIDYVSKLDKPEKSDAEVYFLRAISRFYLFVNDNTRGQSEMNSVSSDFKKAAELDNRYHSKRMKFLDNMDAKIKSAQQNQKVVTHSFQL